MPGGGNLFLRTPWLTRIGPFDTDMGPTGHDLGGSEDLDWVLRALRLGARLRYVPDMVQYHYVDTSRLTLGYMMKQGLQAHRVDGTYRTACGKRAACAEVPVSQDRRVRLQGLHGHWHGAGGASIWCAPPPPWARLAGHWRGAVRAASRRTPARLSQPRPMPSLRNLHKLLDPEIRAKNLRALHWALRGLWWDVTRPAVPDPVFVVGCSRSGTTVTYETLAAAPQFLKFGWEIPQFWDGLYGPLNNGWESEAAGAETRTTRAPRPPPCGYFYQRLGAGWVLDKTCINVMRIPYLHALFPQARFVFIQRDGRDNISSMMDGWRMGRTDGRFELSQFFGPFPEPVAINSGEFKEWSFFLAPGWRQYNHASLEEVCAFQWISANRMALEAKKAIPAAQWVHLRYEDIFERPVEMFHAAFAQLGVPFTPDLQARCAHLQPTSVVSGTPKKQKWKEHNPEAVERVLPMIRAVDAARWAMTSRSDDAAHGQRRHSRLQRGVVRAQGDRQRARAGLRDFELLVVRRRQHRRHGCCAGPLWRCHPRRPTSSTAGCRTRATRASAQSRGEFVAFLDADDWWLPAKLSRQVALLRARPDARLLLLRGEGRRHGRPTAQPVGMPDLAGPFLAHLFGSGADVAGSCSAVLARRRWCSRSAPSTRRCAAPRTPTCGCAWPQCPATPACPNPWP